jgi:hypothetical protein
MRVVYTGFLKTGSRSICDFSKRILNYEMYQGNHADLHSHPTDIFFKNAFTMNQSDMFSCINKGVVSNKTIYDYIDRHQDIVVKEFPYFGMYKYIHDNYDNSKFIICIRNSDETFESYKNFINGYMPHMYHKINIPLLGIPGPINDEHKEKFKLVYEAHNYRVLNFFKDKPDKLLVLNFEEIGTKTFENKISTFIGIENHDIKMKNLKDYNA